MGILNRKDNIKNIKEEIKTYIEDNDTGDVNPVIHWDALKAVLRGKLIALTATQKQARKTTHKSVNVSRRTHTRNQLILEEITDIRMINEILRGEMEKKARFWFTQQT